MARITKPLTSTEAANAKPKDKQYAKFDGGGLRLVIKPNGSKLWRFDYKRPYTKKAASISFGIYPETTLANARKERDKAKALLAQNIDPHHHKQEQTQLTKAALDNTLEATTLEWFAIKKTKVSEDYGKDIFRSLELHIMPTLGSTPIHMIKAPATIDALKPLAAKGNLETVKRICQRLNEVMYFAVNSGLIDPKNRS